MKLPVPIKSGSPHQQKTRIIAAISGGPDSIYLLHQLLDKFPGVQIIVAHFNHNQRGKDSRADQKFTEQTAKKLGLKFVTAGLKSAQKIKGNLEDFLRNRRYQFLEQVRRGQRAELIVTAHHLGDQIETFFLNLSRGASLSGFKAMESYDPIRRIFRPLLQTSKEEILGYLKKNKIPYRTDSSNFNLNLKRNYLRHKILPLFSKLNPAFERTAGESLQHLQNNIKLIEQLAHQWLQANLKTLKKQVYFPLAKFLAEAPVIQSAILKNLFRRNSQKSIGSAQIREILNVLNKNKSNLQKEFGGSAKQPVLLKIKKASATGKRIVVIGPAKS